MKDAGAGGVRLDRLTIEAQFAEEAWTSKGTPVEIADEVTEFAVGDRVFAVRPDKGFAEFRHGPKQPWQSVSAEGLEEVARLLLRTAARARKLGAGAKIAEPKRQRREEAVRVLEQWLGEFDELLGSR